jgi:hypothetical protein
MSAAPFSGSAIVPTLVDEALLCVERVDDRRKVMADRAAFLLAGEGECRSRASGDDPHVDHRRGVRGD